MWRLHARGKACPRLFPLLGTVRVLYRPSARVCFFSVFTTPCLLAHATSGRQRIRMARHAASGCERSAASAVPVASIATADSTLRTTYRAIIPALTLLAQAASVVGDNVYPIKLTLRE